MTKRTIVSEQKFRDEAKAGAAPADASLRKAFITECKAAEDQARAIDFTISTASVDRMGDTIAVNGWRLENYRKNPVVLWAHDSSMLPVGRATNVRVEEGKLKARAEFAPASVSPMADSVYEMLKLGFLSATSVGFAPIKYAFSEEAGRKFGIDFLEQELLEFSVVPIPANAEALIEARAAGIDIKLHQEWASKLLALDGYAVIPRSQLGFINALPESLRDTAKRLPDSAKSAAGVWRRVANTIEKSLNGSAPIEPEKIIVPFIAAKTPARDAARRQLEAFRARLK